MGNFGTDDDDYEGLAPTGFYSVNNIYDLAGNIFEWTLEAYGSSTRFMRGGTYSYTGTGVTSAAYADVTMTTNISGAIGSRMVLY